MAEIKERRGRNRPRSSCSRSLNLQQHQRRQWFSSCSRTPAHAGQPLLLWLAARDGEKHQLSLEICGSEQGLQGTHSVG
eukprot:3560366-Amphidinium_carterae.1